MVNLVSASIYQVSGFLTKRLTYVGRHVVPTSFCLNPTEGVPHAASLSLQEGPRGRWTALPVQQHEWDAALETYSVVLAASLRPGPTRYRVRIKYVAPVGDSLKGLYRVSYQDENNGKR